MRKHERCPIKEHKEMRVYFARWDMFACLECNAWLSKQCDCSPANCNFAWRRAYLDPSKEIEAGVRWELRP